MRYPLLTSYLEVLKNPFSLFRSLKRVEVAIDERGEPYYYSGSFAVVFKVFIDGRPYAMKCFTQGGDQQANYCKLISSCVSESCKNDPRLINYNYIENEIFVFCSDTESGWFPVVVMDWVAGENLRCNIERQCRSANTDKLKIIVDKFANLALWLLEQDFAHGDLKDENIMIRRDGTLTLIDYDGFYTPKMNGLKSNEIGTPFYQHPLRDEIVFDKSIDDYPIALIYTALQAIVDDPKLFINHHRSEGLIFDPIKVFKHEDKNLRQTLNKWFLEGRSWDYFVGNQLYSITPNLPALHKYFAYVVNRPLGLACVVFEEYGEFGFLNEKGEPIIAPIYDYADEFCEELSHVKHLGNDYFIDTNAVVVISLPEYSYVESFSSGLAKVCDSQAKIGYVDKTGKLVIKCRFVGARSFSDGFAAVKIDEKWGYIDKSGNIVVEPIYDRASSFKDGVAKVYIDDSEVFISLSQCGCLRNDMS